MAEKSKKKRTSKAVKAALVEKAVDAEAVVEAAVAESTEAAAEPVASEVPDPVDAVDTPGADAAAVPVADAEPVTVTVDELVGAAPAPAEAPADGGGTEPAPVEEPVSSELKAIVEALVFASPDPLTPKAIIKLLDSEPKEEVERAIAALKDDYKAARGLHLVEVAGGLQIVTRPDLNEWVRRLFHERKTTRLSVQSLETLAVIAYRQPVTSAEIAEIRGVNTSGVLSTLVERRLIKTAGRKAVVGRPFLYATTKEFLLRFGLNDVSDLPKVDDLADVLGFELPGLLNEGLPTDQLLPLGEPEDIAAPSDAPVGEEPALEPASDEPSEEPVADEPAVDELPADEPAVEEPVAGEPAVDEPVFEESVPDDSEPDFEV
jgi:segregation and condensation protein B